MKIVEIIPQLSSGGAERFTVDLCNELAPKHDVTLIVLHSIDKNGFYAAELSKDVKLISMNKRKGADLSLPFRLRKAIEKIAPDVVHTHLRGITYGFLAALTLRKIKFFHTIHSAAAKEAGGGVSAWVRKFSFSRSLIKAVTISPESHRSFNEFYNNASATMIVNGRNIPPKIEISEAVAEEFKGYRKGDDCRVLVNLASINVVKRQPMLAKIAARLESEGYNFTLLLIGKKLDQALVSEIESHNCKSLHILGERTNPLEYLALCDAFCLGSSYEGMPISLIEAMGVGAIAVCTPVGGIVDVIENGKNGFISRDISEESYYNTLKEFLDLPASKMEQLREESRKSYEPYSMTECATRYEELFKQ